MTFGKGDPNAIGIDEDMEAVMERFAGVRAAGLCPFCGDLIASERLVNGWLIASPCNHRLGKPDPDPDADFGWSEPSYD